MFSVSGDCPKFDETGSDHTTCLKVCLHFTFQKQAMLVRQLEEEVVKTRQHAKETNPEVKAHIEALQMENDHLTREVAILKETTKVTIYFKLFFYLSIFPRTCTKIPSDCVPSPAEFLCLFGV